MNDSHNEPSAVTPVNLPAAGTAQSDKGPLYIVGIGKQITLQFQDTGGGIPENKLVKLGEPFYSTKEKGTGLGLMLSTKIIENHQSTIRFQSKERIGTTVIFTLPGL